MKKTIGLINAGLNVLTGLLFLGAGIYGSFTQKALILPPYGVALFLILGGLSLMFAWLWRLAGGSSGLGIITLVFWILCFLSGPDLFFLYEPQPMFDRYFAAVGVSEQGARQAVHEVASQLSETVEERILRGRYGAKTGVRFKLSPSKVSIVYRNVLSVEGSYLHTSQENSLRDVGGRLKTYFIEHKGAEVSDSVMYMVLIFIGAVILAFTFYNSGDELSSLFET